MNHISATISLLPPPLHLFAATITSPSHNQHRNIYSPNPTNFTSPQAPTPSLLPHILAISKPTSSQLPHKNHHHHCDCVPLRLTPSLRKMKSLVVFKSFSISMPLLLRNDAIEKKLFIFNFSILPSPPTHSDPHNYPPSIVTITTLQVP